jgi:D-alanyl-D-alanine dipeptidase
MRRPPLPIVLKFPALGSILAFLLFAAGCRTAPPREPGAFRNPDLVEIIKLDPTIRPDIRYATANNFTGHPLYAQPRAFLQRPAAEALTRAHKALQAQGYGILVYDAYRPWSVTKGLWDAATPSEQDNGFVADPDTGSKHNRGCAVDVGLYDLKTGREVDMPSGYDEFSARAYPDYAGGPAEARRSRDLLRQAMEAEGFEVSKNEWWHFNYRDWKAYRLLDIPFEDLAP